MRGRFGAVFNTSPFSLIFVLFTDNINLSESIIISQKSEKPKWPNNSDHQHWIRNVLYSFPLINESNIGHHPTLCLVITKLSCLVH